jgi:hypothetical protein
MVEALAVASRDGWDGVDTKIATILCAPAGNSRDTFER